MNYSVHAQPLGWLQESMLVTLNSHSQLFSVILFQWFMMLILVCIPLSNRDPRALRTLGNLCKWQEGGPACSAALR